MRSLPDINPAAEFAFLSIQVREVEVGGKPTGGMPLFDDDHLLLLLLLLAVL